MTNRPSEAGPSVESAAVACSPVVLEALGCIADGIIVIDADGRLLLANEAARALGMTDPAPGSSYSLVATAWILYFEDGRPVPVEERPLARALRGETVREAPFCLTDAKGGERHVVGTASAVRDAAGAIVGAALVFRDVTEKWRAEEALRRSRDELEDRVSARTAELTQANLILRESEERYRSLAEAAHDMIFIVGRSGAVEYVNSYAAAQFGRSPAALVGRRLDELFPPADAERQGANVKRVLATGTPLSFENRTRFPGGEKWLDTWLVPLRDGRGEVRGALGISRDATKRKEAERFRDEYVSLVSHDLGSPLAAIGVRAAWLSRRLGEQALEAEASEAERIVESVQSMGAMLHDLADSARFESGTIELDLQSVELGGVVGAAIERVITPADRDRVRVEIASDLGLVVADPARIERVVVNYLSNALKYARPPAPVTVAARREQAELVVSVADSGPGIAPAEVPLLFDRYYRAATGRRTEGLGLGLFICRLIIEKHGGRVWAESEVGRGSVFSFSLPAS